MKTKKIEKEVRWTDYMPRQEQSKNELIMLLKNKLKEAWLIIERLNKE